MVRDCGRLARAARRWRSSVAPPSAKLGGRRRSRAELDSIPNEGCRGAAPCHSPVLALARLRPRPRLRAVAGPHAGRPRHHRPGTDRFVDVRRALHEGSRGKRRRACRVLCGRRRGPRRGPDQSRPITRGRDRPCASPGPPRHGRRDDGRDGGFAGRRRTPCCRGVRRAAGHRVDHRRGWPRLVRAGTSDHGHVVPWAWRWKPATDEGAPPHSLVERERQRELSGTDHPAALLRRHRGLLPLLPEPRPRVRTIGSPAGRHRRTAAADHRGSRCAM